LIPEFRTFCCIDSISLPPFPDLPNLSIDVLPWQKFPHYEHSKIITGIKKSPVASSTKLTSGYTAYIYCRLTSQSKSSFWKKGENLSSVDIMTMVQMHMLKARRSTLTCKLR